MAMNGVAQTMFNCIKCEICGQKEKIVLPEVSARFLAAMYQLSKAHDVAHLVGDALNKSGVFENLPADLDENERAAIAKIKEKFDEQIFTAVYRYETINYELEQICKTLEEAEIPFILLKGSVIRKYYPEPWMRTSCDIDILVKKEDLDKASLCLTNNLQYLKEERATHDISFFSTNGVHIELHFDLVEEGRAKNANKILSGVWEQVVLSKGSNYCYEMHDAFFYFYHIAHMAKHLESGGCGVRPFIDLLILDNMDLADNNERNELLSKGALLQFANASRKLSKVWFIGDASDDISGQMQEFVLQGGSYGSVDNRVAAKKKHGKIRYLLSRIFIPWAKLKRYYPILEIAPILMPIMQIRRWFMLLNPNVRKMVKMELSANKNIQNTQLKDTQTLLKNIGL